MRKIIFICLRYLDADNRVTIGGIQTYITNLINIAKEIDLECIVIQPASQSFRIERESVEIVGIDTSEEKGFYRFKSDLFTAAKREYNDGDIVLFATERLTMKTSIPNTIAIQHGISWDITLPRNRNIIQRTIFIARRSIRTVSLIQDSLRVKKLVCVDYNYINWLRTQVDSVDVDYVTIPNFSKIPQEKYIKQENGIINIIFARRLQEFRGTRLFGRSIKRILDEFTNIRVTIAGDGPEELYLRELLIDYPVEFITYSNNDALKINAEQHIAVVPSLGSEGTSLSLIEAMASHCAPIATDVGGMTNLIIDRFNGLLVKPTEDSLYDALKYLIINNEERKIIADNAYETAKNAFSYERWKNQWIKVIKEIGE